MAPLLRRCAATRYATKEDISLVPNKQSSVAAQRHDGLRHVSVV